MAVATTKASSLLVSLEKYAVTPEAYSLRMSSRVKIPVKNKLEMHRNHSRLLHVLWALWMGKGKGARAGLRDTIEPARLGRV